MLGVILLLVVFHLKYRVVLLILNLAVLLQLNVFLQPLRHRQIFLVVFEFLLEDFSRNTVHAFGHLEFVLVSEQFAQFWP